MDPGKKRLVAEWEPALGAFVTWPAALPGALLRDLALDAHLWVLVTDAASETDAAAWFASQGVSPDRVTFVRAPQGDDAVWVRDWGPHPVMDEHGQLWCVGPRYVYATPFTAHEPGAPLETAGREPLAALESEPVDQRAQPALARTLGLPFEKLPRAFTGDNVLSDGHDLLITTEVLVAENRFDGATWDEVRQDASAATGMGEHVVLPDYENWGIQHADCLLKVLDEEQLLVLRPPGRLRRHPGEGGDAAEPPGGRRGDHPHAHAGDRTERRVHGPPAAGPASGEIEYAVEVTSEDGRVQRWPRPSKAWLRAAID
ncbi:agmatine deiminase family protein [Kocuria marina]|uniref:agmatine deiminase family protein n=1 Tax=Kocuria marina TaxID=223184 RepID=UPI002989E381|nr:agmatine deiminase family protein [Kocuria marina]MCT1722044.1 agmatine deiminase family protein [Kocuria marina]MCT1735311.1 agmatine deiminase family protein [Kocuria marina]